MKPITRTANDQTYKVRATFAAAGFRGWRLEWHTRDVYQRVLNGERVAVVSQR